MDPPTSPVILPCVCKGVKNDLSAGDDLHLADSLLHFLELWLRIPGVQEQDLIAYDAATYMAKNQKK